jgi:hypothetical protein
MVCFYFKQKPYNCLPMLHRRRLYKWVRLCVGLSVRSSRIGFRMLAYERKVFERTEKIRISKIVGLRMILRPYNMSLVCLYLSLYISFLSFGHFKKKMCCHAGKKKCPNDKKQIYNDKYKHTRDRLFGLLYM